MASRSHEPDPTERLKALAFVVLGISGVIVWRMFQKSVIEHPLYAARAESQYEVSKELPSKRGSILAQDAELGSVVPLASTEERFDISVVPKNVKDKAGAAHTLATLFGLDEQDVLANVSTDKLYLPPLVRGAPRTSGTRSSPKVLPACSLKSTTSGCTPKTSWLPRY